ncbi:MAG: helix-turn-helix domain-containing protein [Pirellula sp.]
MASYVSLDEAAKILGISPDELVEMRSRGEIFGYRDGTSWKFKSDEIERVQAELGGDALDEEAGGSSILISERQVGPSGSKSGSTIGKASSSDVGLGSESKKSNDGSHSGSDVALVPDPKSGSGLRLVNKTASGKGASDSSALSDSKIQSDGTGSGSGSGSEVELGSDLKLVAGGASDSGVNLMGKDSGILSGSGSGVGSSGSLGLGGDLDLAKDDEDDLVLGSDSGVGLGSESGINLMSPSDSGLSLEDEPLDLAGTGISGLDLGAEGSGSGSGSGGSVSGASGLGSGALIDFQQGEEFQLTPSSGGIEVDDDSGSQVIELEDSTEFGSAQGVGGEFDPIQEGFGDGGFGDEAALVGGAAGAGAAMRGIPETPYSTWEIAGLLGILLMMGLSGLIVTDLMRNMWAWDGQNNYTTGLISILVKAIGGK